MLTGMKCCDRFSVKCAESLVLMCSSVVNEPSSHACLSDSTLPLYELQYSIPIYQMMMSYFKGTADAVAEYCTAVSCPNAPNTFQRPLTPDYHLGT